MERAAGHDEKRHKMMADLERREQGWAAARTQASRGRRKGLPQPLAQPRADRSSSPLAQPLRHLVALSLRLSTG